MHSFRTGFILISFFLSAASGFSQYLDSLEKSLLTAINDTVKIRTLHKLCLGYVNNDVEKAEQFVRQALTLSEKMNYAAAITESLNRLGLVHRVKGKYDKAIDYYFQAMKRYEVVRDTYGIADMYSKIGIVYYFLQAKNKALDNYFKSLELFEKINEEDAVAVNLNNIASVYADLKDEKKSLEYHLKALAVFQKLKNNNSVAASLANIGKIYQNQKNFQKAGQYYEDALQKFNAMNDKSGMAATLIGMGNLSAEKQDFLKANEYLQKALLLCEELGHKEYLKEVFIALAEAGNKQGDFKNAYKYHQLYSDVKDSLFNDEFSSQIAEMQTKYETEKKEKEIKLLNKDKVISETENKKQKVIIWSVVGGLLLVAVFSLMMLNRWRITQRQKKIIEAQKKIVDEQKKIVEEKNKDITDSIEYASRIQQAILPEPKEFEEMFPDSFVLYKPKDIVAGDFYWTAKNNGSRFLLTADCTGHGVPGAFMSMIGSALYNDAVNEKNISQPDLIFNEVRKGIIRALRQKGNEFGQKDGMDAVLCRFSTGENKKTMLECSCANNAVIIIKSTGDAIEIPADRFPVGTFGDTERPFTLHALELEKGDIVYSFTDGYHDQFGGEKGKKLKYSRFKEILLSIHKTSMNEQQKTLHEKIEKWKGNLEQIDDICVIGVRI